VFLKIEEGRRLREAQGDFFRIFVIFVVIVVS